MTEFLFIDKNYINPDPEKHRRGVHVKGDFWNYKPDGWSSRPNWAQSKYPQVGVVIKCPEISYAEAEAADQRRPWLDDFDYEVISASQAQVTLRVWNRNASPSGVNQLTRERVETFLTQWGCTDISFNAGSVTFTFDLWNAARSDAFWDIDLVGTKAIFTLLSYNPTTKIAQINAEIQRDNWNRPDVSVSLDIFIGLMAADGQTFTPGVSEYTINGVVYTVSVEEISLTQWELKVKRPMNDEEFESYLMGRMLNRIIEIGGEDAISIFPNIRFSVERDAVVSKFRRDIKQKAEKVYKRHRYSIAPSEVDAIRAVGGIVTMSRAELISKITDHMSI